jgi:hypothetical protein
VNAPARIAELERQLHWAQLKIQVLEEKLRQRRIQQLGPKSETLSKLQLELLAEEEPSFGLAERRRRLRGAFPQPVARDVDSRPVGRLIVRLEPGLDGFKMGIQSGSVWKNAQIFVA